MLKSEIYYAAQICVMESEQYSSDEKLLILKELMAKEDLELFAERQAQEEKANER